MESYGLSFDPHFSFKYFQKDFFKKISLKQSHFVCTMNKLINIS